MGGKRQLAGLMTAFSLMIPGHPQERDYLTDHAEQILSRDEDYNIPDEVLEQHQELNLDPVNLNSASREVLESSCLFTPYQSEMIVAYRERYGELLSVYELASLSGFRISRLKEIAPFITVETIPRSRYRRSAGHRILLYTGRSFPDAIGYKSTGPEREVPAYEGSPLELSLRIQSGIGRRITFGLAYSKDAGEKGFRDYAPEYLTGNICYRGYRKLEHLVAGSYRLHSGMGLVHGTGFVRSTDGYTSQPHLLSSLKPYAGVSESSVNRGVACQLNFSPVRVLVWSSMQPMDLSAGNIPDSEAGMDWVLFRRESGMHRTTTETGGESLGYLAHAGILAKVRFRNLSAGAQFTTELNGLTKRGQDSLQLANSPTCFNSVSLFWNWQKGRLEAFGEYSPGRSESSAALAGFRMHFSAFLSGSLLLHYYGSSHRETFSSAYARGSHISNEKGLALQLHAEPGSKLLADLSLEFFDHPAPRYQCRVPSSAARCQVVVKNTGGGPLRWTFRFTERIWQTTSDRTGPGISAVVTSRMTRLEGRLEYQPKNSFRWQSRLIVSGLRTDHPDQGNQPGPGYAAVQQVSLRPWASLGYVCQFVVFNTSLWDNRIYIYEPGLYHQFNFPVCYGKGQKLSTVISVKTGKRATLEGKGTMIIYHDRDQVGSGNDLVEGSCSYFAGIQWRLSL